MDIGFWIFALLVVLFVGSELVTGVAVGYLGLVKREEVPFMYWVLIAMHAGVAAFVLYSMTL